MWRIRKLTLGGKTTIFKSSAVSKIEYLALLTTIPNSIIEELKQIQKIFLWGSKKSQNQTWCVMQQIWRWVFEKCWHSPQSSRFVECSWIRRLWVFEFPINILDSSPLFYKQILGCSGIAPKHQQCFRQLVHNIYRSTIVLILTAEWSILENSQIKK